MSVSPKNRPCELRARGCAGAICHGRFWWELYQWITLDWRVGRRFQWCFVGHAARFLCSLPKVSDIATGIALMLLGVGLAFYFGKSLIQPQAVQIPSIELGA